MTRTSKTLKRLGIAGLAVATIGAGAPALIASAAQASGPVTTVTLTPATNHGAAGSCIAYTANVKDLTGSNVSGATVTVSITGGASATQDVDFCTLPTGTTQPQSPSVISNQGAQANSTDVATFTTDANGNAIFGVTAREPGTVAVRAFYDANNDKAFSAGEPTATDTATFNTGGPAGSNTNQDAAKTVTVTPAGTDTAVVGETRTFTVNVKNATNENLNGVTVNYSTTPGSAGQAQTFPSTVCGSTDNNGNVKCNVTFTAAGTDNLSFFVNQTTGGTNGLDGTEPSAAVTETVNAAPNSAYVVTLACDADGSAANTSNANNGGAATTAASSAGNCTNDIRDTSRTFTATVNASSATGAATVDGVPLSFTVSGGSGDETVAPAEANSGANGAGTGATTVTVTDPTPAVGEVLTLTVAIRGTSAKDTGTLTFANAPTDARYVTVTAPSPDAPGTVVPVTATVTDVYGKPVQGVNVTLTENGAGAWRNGFGSQTGGTTDANGKVSADLTSLPTETGSNTITADITNGTFGTTNECGAAAGKNAAGAALTGAQANAAAGNCKATTTVVFATPSPSPSSSTTPPSGRQALALVVNTPTINAGTTGKMTVTGSANQAIQLVCYTRPSTTYKVARNATINAAGDPVVFTLSLGMNTRCFAQYATNSAQDASPSGVINVKTVVSIFVVRNATRDYTFQGHNLPKYAGQLITLYYVNSNGDNVRKGFVKTDSTGIYHIPVKFVSNGTFTFFVRTGQTLTNAAGESNHVSVSIH